MWRLRIVRAMCRPPGMRASPDDGRRAGALARAAALLFLFVKKWNLIGAMFTGRKRVPSGVAASDGRMASNWLALILLAATAGVVAVIVN